jgi:hypothetical protein
MADDEHERRLTRGRHGLLLDTAQRGRRPRAFVRAGALAGVLLLGAFAATGCGAAPPRSRPLYVLEAPPPDPVELEGSAPSAAYTWVKGHYSWNGVEYVWIPGAWAPRPSTRATWIAGRWEHTRRGWIWVDGHWS